MIIDNVEKRFTGGIIYGGKAPRLKEVLRTYALVHHLGSATERIYYRRIELLEDILNKPITAIYSADIVDRLLLIAAERGPAASNNVFNILRALCNFASSYYEYPSRVIKIRNPCSNLRWRAPKRYRELLQLSQLKFVVYSRSRSLSFGNETNN